MPSMIRALACVAALFLAGCATMPDANNDPLEPVNRAIFNMNDQLDENVALPVARAYRNIFPPPVQHGIHNFLSNLDRPITFVNNVLEADPTAAVQTAGRFVINSTLGIAGFIDVAADMGIPNKDRDFGETLGMYGVGEGPYLVLPVLGPKPPRDLIGEIADIFFDPFNYSFIPLREKFWWMAGRETMELVDKRAANIDTLATIKRTSIDYYATMRSLYRQSRNSEIHKGDTELEMIPDF